MHGTAGHTYRIFNNIYTLLVHFALIFCVDVRVGRGRGYVDLWGNSEVCGTLCGCMCICVYVCIYAHVWMCVCMYVYVCTRASLPIYPCPFCLCMCKYAPQNQKLASVRLNPVKAGKIHHSDTREQKATGLVQFDLWVSATRKKSDLDSNENPNMLFFWLFSLLLSSLYFQGTVGAGSYFWTTFLLVSYYYFLNFLYLFLSDLFF